MNQIAIMESKIEVLCKQLDAANDEISNLRCCGNCKYYTAKLPCLLHKKQNAGAYCGEWEQDGLTRKDREK